MTRICDICGGTRRGYDIAAASDEARCRGHEAPDIIGALRRGAGLCDDAVDGMRISDRKTEYANRVRADAQTLRDLAEAVPDIVRLLRLLENTHHGFDVARALRGLAALHGEGEK